MSVGAVVGVIGLSTASAFAQTTPAQVAIDEYEQGRGLLAQAMVKTQKFTVRPDATTERMLVEAAEHFERAVKATVGIPYGWYTRLATVYAELGRIDDANSALLRGTRHGSTPEDADALSWAERAKALLLSKGGAVQLPVVALLRIDGVELEVGRFTPPTLYLSVGKHAISASATGGVDLQTQCVESVAGETITLKLPLDGSTCVSDAPPPPPTAECTTNSGCSDGRICLSGGVCGRPEPSKGNTVGLVLGAIFVTAGALGTFTAVGLLVGGLAATPPSDWGTAGWVTLAASAGSFGLGLLFVFVSTPARTVSLSVSPSWVGVKGQF